MANYVKTGPFTNGSAPGISASFLNNVENVFEAVSGGTESGHYFLAGNGPSNGAVISIYVFTLSRTSTPVSVNIDTTDTAPAGNLASPGTASLTSGGFQLWSTVTASSNNGRCGGGWTVHY